MKRQDSKEMISLNDTERKIKSTQAQIRTELKKLTMPCPICAEPYKHVAKHAKKAHGISTADFKKKYRYTTAINACALKIMDLYVPDRKRHIQQYTTWKGDEVRYRTISPETAMWGSGYLTTKDLTAHIRGTKTYGAMFYPNASRCLVFDIDIDLSSEMFPNTSFYTYNELNAKYLRRFAAQPTSYLEETLLKNGIPPRCIHILHSGKKGFHIDLYFDHWVNIEKLICFGEHIIDQTYEEIADQFGPEFDSWEKIPRFNIELRPEGRDGRGVRFPLGIHRETGSLMEYCCKYSYSYPAVKNQYHYLLYKTKRITREIFEIDAYPNVKKTFPNVKNTSPHRFSNNPQPSNLPGTAPTANIGSGANNHRKSRHYTREELEEFLEDGLRQHGTRHNVSVGLAILFKEKGFTQVEAYNKLISWNYTKTYQYSKSSSSQIKKDVKQIVHYTYTKDYHLKASEEKRWLLTDTDVKAIARYFFLTLKERKTLATMFMLRRLYGPDAYYPQKLIAEIIGCTDRTVRTHIKKFIDLGILRLTYKGNSYQKTSNKYKVIDYQEDYSSALSFQKANLDGNAFTKGLKKFMSKEFIRTEYSPYNRTFRIHPIKMRGFETVKHPSIPSEKNSLPEMKPRRRQDHQQKIDGRKFFNSMIRIFRWVRRMKKKYGANWAKIYPSWEGHYMRC